MKKFVLLFAAIIFCGYSFAQTVVSPGDGTLADAIVKAKDGDVLALVPGGVYTEKDSAQFANITGKTITIEVQGDNPTKAILKENYTQSTPNFFVLGDKASIILKNLEFDGSQSGIATDNHLIAFSVGTVAASTEIGLVKVDNCYIHDFAGDVLNAGSSGEAGNLLIDSTFVNNCLVVNTGTSVYYKYGGASFISVTNSTFSGINSYGMRISGPQATQMPDHTANVVVDHTTWYNIGTSDSREILLCDKGGGAYSGTWTVTNSIFDKQINKDKGVINIKGLVDSSLATITNIDLWDVGKREWRGETVKDTLNIDPEFKDTTNGDFTLPKGSQLLTFASDGGAIGDPRWATNATAVQEPIQNQPLTYKLDQNYPNPFNPTTKISFTLKKSGMTTLEVYNILGRRVATLVNGNLTAGTHSVNFNADNLSSGVYLYKLESNNKILTKKMVLLK